MDAKYNEMILYDDVRQLTKFADFVFSFLGKFAIDKTTRHINLTDETANNIGNTFTEDENRY